MNKFKKSLLFCMSFVLAFSFLIAPLPKTRDKKVFSAPSSNINLVDDTLLNSVTISTDGQTLTKDKIKTIDSNADNKDDTSFVFANRTVTINLKPFDYSYTYLTFDSSLFYKQTDTFTLTRPTREDSFPTTFTYKDVDYSYQISGDNKLTVRNSKTYISYSETDIVSILDTETTRTFTFDISYTLKAEAPNTTFAFVASNSSSNTYKTTQYTINFERPITNFKTDDVTMFTCTGLDVGDTPFVNPKIEKELSYENIKLQFTNNDYTEYNPLYFDINHNGFIYTFKLYSKVYDSEEMLFVEYFDEQRNSNNESLATKLDENGNVVYDSSSPVYKYYGATTEYNMFSIDFNKTGRYELSVYDETYLLNLKDNNFYSTSFYIKTSDSSNTDSAFENAYAIMQNYDDEGNFYDYIVSGSTQNNNVQITLKNLSFYFENDEVISSFTPTEEMPELNVVEFIKTTLAGSSNIPVSTYYSVSTLKEYLETSQNFTIDCSDDAFYEVIIYQYSKTADGSYTIKDKTSYQFTIVKQPKISFTYFLVDQNNDPIPIPGTNKYETDIDETDTPFVKVPRNYKLNINSEMEILTYFRNPSTPRTSLLQKTYLNNYTINYAMQSVKIEKVEIKEPGTDNVLKVLALQFFGVGDITVEVTVNSITKEYTVKSGEILTFEDYGVYSVAIEDSMGTVGTDIFKYSKPVSTSAVILVVLLGIIALAIVLFVISSRGKLKTR